MMYWVKSNVERFHMRYQLITENITATGEVSSKGYRTVSDVMYRLANFSPSLFYAIYNNETNLFVGTQNVSPSGLAVCPVHEKINYRVPPTV